MKTLVETLVLLLSIMCFMTSLRFCKGMHSGYVFERGEYYYKFVPQLTDNRTFAEALEICRDEEGGNLLTVGNSDEMKWLEEKLQYMNYRCKNLGRLWLGAIDKRISRIYEYIDGTPFRFRDVPWLPGEPNRNRRRPYYYCLFMTTRDNAMEWGDEDCYVAYGYVCKAIGIPSRLRELKRSGFEFETDIYRYKFIPSPWDNLPWSEARLYCQESEAGDLLTIADKHEDQIVAHTMRHLRQYLGFDKVWIGANDYERTGNFTWSRSEPFVYSKFASNVSLAVGQRSGDCVAASGNLQWGQRWTVEDCLQNLPFICKIRRCLGLTDIVFIVDRSVRVSEKRFEQIKTFIWQTVRLFPFMYGETKVALVTYANKPTGLFGFNTHNTPEELQKAINSAIYTGGAPMLHEALKLTRYGLFTRVGVSRQGVVKMVVLITGGWDKTNSRETLQIEQEVVNLQRRNVHRIAVGIGKYVSKKDLLEVASSPRDIVMVQPDSDIRRQVPTMRDLLCGKSMEIQTLGLRRRRRH